MKRVLLVIALAAVLASCSDEGVRTFVTPYPKRLTWVAEVDGQGPVFGSGDTIFMHDECLRVSPLDSGTVYLRMWELATNRPYAVDTLVDEACATDSGSVAVVCR